jgi:hypothetical protein
MILIGCTKTHEVIFKWYYGITFNDVSKVINGCTVCNCTAKAVEKPPIILIISKGCLHRIVIDLMDFRSNMDGPCCWIIQIKDHFSRYIWLEEMIDKEATTIADIIRRWIGANGRPHWL